MNKNENILLVEGTNDLHVISAFCKSHKIPESFKIESCGSDNQVIKKLDALLMSSQNNIKTIGIILDADERGFYVRLKEFEKIVLEKDYIIPTEIKNSGIVLEIKNDIKVGAWIMPNNKDYGRIEDFLLEMINCDAKEFATKCAKEAQLKKYGDFKDIHISKALIHSYLAWQDEPGTPMGLSITKSVLKPNTDTAILFKEWLLKMFN